MNSEYRSPSPAPPVFRNLNGLHLSDSLDKTASYLARTGYVGPKYEADNYDSDSDDTSDSDCSDMSSSFRGSHDGHPYRPDNESGASATDSDKPFTPPRSYPLAPEDASSPSEKEPTLLAAGPELDSQRASNASSSNDDDSERGADCGRNLHKDNYAPWHSSPPKKHSQIGTIAKHVAALPKARASTLPHRGLRRALAPRNRQAEYPEAVIQIISSKTAAECNYTCPVCGRKQEHERTPDFKRHLKTHLRPKEEEMTKGWRCKGVLLQDARNWGIPDNATVYSFLGKQRVGGCLKTFSRRDALKRHLDSPTIWCVGLPHPPTEE